MMPWLRLPIIIAAGAGSFGVVRECMEASTGRKYAVKTIGKIPKRGACECPTSSASAPIAEPSGC